jgi:hypothetical protein
MIEKAKNSLMEMRRQLREKERGMQIFLGVKKPAKKVVKAK